eukprot:TRINITY_DN40833_c0_g1_i1.p1 TRINITY_DN40833_c0_g1~~TRINITY_DN40833_c0_g1_i1.p1  ORF type:complete len:602 (+),score=79.92 TRINITY_DN40833_c0_g1_i1:36-1808(+)
MMSSFAEELQRLAPQIDRAPAVVIRKSGGSGIELIDWSPLVKLLPVEPSDRSKGGAASKSDFFWNLLRGLAEEEGGCGASVGCLLGLAIGDSCGAPLEFTSVDSRLPEGANGRYADRQRSCLLPELSTSGQLTYIQPYNSFSILPGQWTDDTSMALCLADSLLVHGRYHGGDARVRWHMWWNHGYCNAFRHDLNRKRGRRSVGLGGNVAKSLAEVEDTAFSKRCEHDADAVPPINQATANDAGNGSIMRLGPVPIAYHVFERHALQVACWQSLATHPGGDAAVCCSFMSFFIVGAIRCAQEASRTASHEVAVPHPSDQSRDFIQERIDSFLRLPQPCIDGLPDGQASLFRLKCLLESNPASKKEAHWNWKLPELPITPAIAARVGRSGEDTYNGHPVIPTYFGAYCMDGLAMALWALWHGSDFSSCVRLAVNLLGDADTVGAITGQLAGAVYGWRGIISDEWGRRCVANLRYWDSNAEVGLRAALLYHHGPRPNVKLCQAEGFPSVRVFAMPAAREAILGEIPSGTWVKCVRISSEFVRVIFGELDGWVGAKNVQSWGDAEGTEDLYDWLPGSVRKANDGDDVKTDFRLG